MITHALAFSFGALLLLVIVRIGMRHKSCANTYDLINPQLQCDEGLRQGEWDYEPLRDILLAKKQTFKDAGVVSHISVYFRDLDHGPRFGIGEYDKFHPASLRKVPVLIAYLHLADLDRKILDKTASFSGALNANPNVEESEQTIVKNTPYTVRELLKKMIV